MREHTITERFTRTWKVSGFSLAYLFCSSSVSCSSLLVFSSGRLVAVVVELTSLLSSPSHPRRSSSPLEFPTGTWHMLFLARCSAPSEVSPVWLAECPVGMNGLSPSALFNCCKKRWLKDVFSPQSYNRSSYSSSSRRPPCVYFCDESLSSTSCLHRLRRQKPGVRFIP